MYEAAVVVIAWTGLPAAIAIVPLSLLRFIGRIKKAVLIAQKTRGKQSAGKKHSVDNLIY